MAKPTTYAKALAEKTRLIEIWAEFRRLAAERGAAAPFDVTKWLNESRRRRLQRESGTVAKEERDDR